MQDSSRLLVRGRVLHEGFTRFENNCPKSRVNAAQHITGFSSSERVNAAQKGIAKIHAPHIFISKYANTYATHPFHPPIFPKHKHLQKKIPTQHPNPPSPPPCPTPPLSLPRRPSLSSPNLSPLPPFLPSCLILPPPSLPLPTPIPSSANPSLFYPNPPFLTLIPSIFPSSLPSPPLFHSKSCLSSLSQPIPLPLPFPIPIQPPFLSLPSPPSLLPSPTPILLPSRFPLRFLSPNLPPQLSLPSPPPLPLPPALPPPLSLPSPPPSPFAHPHPYPPTSRKMEKEREKAGSLLLSDLHLLGAFTESEERRSGGVEEGGEEWRSEERVRSGGVAPVEESELSVHHLITSSRAGGAAPVVVSKQGASNSVVDLTTFHRLIRKIILHVLSLASTESVTKWSSTISRMTSFRDEDRTGMSMGGQLTPLCFLQRLQRLRRRINNKILDRKHHFEKQTCEKYEKKQERRSGGVAPVEESELSVHRLITSSRAGGAAPVVVSKQGASNSVVK
ncbi:hypothetical protein C7M84_002885 [Penaeus vannamei]|uniref:Uncharacterized protein n=1 Tax=Penaeus vannamei TaxID=6689 RepID=A0A3R7N6B1_PENVA|nr:hypothetical protein C7M84_002885 [Penaeus vannamei]